MAKYGKLGRAYEYLAMIDNHWKAVPVGWGSAPLPPLRAHQHVARNSPTSMCRRGIPRIEPSTPEASKEWTYDKQLEDGRSLFQGRLSDRLRLPRRRQHRRQSDLGRDVRRLRCRSGEWQGRTSPSISNNVMAAMEYMPEDGEVHAAGCGAAGTMPRTTGR